MQKEVTPMYCMRSQFKLISRDLERLGCKQSVLDKVGNSAKYEKVTDLYLNGQKPDHVRLYSHKERQSVIAFGFYYMDCEPAVVASVSINTVHQPNTKISEKMSKKDFMAAINVFLKTNYWLKPDIRNWLSELSSHLIHCWYVKEEKYNILAIREEYFDILLKYEKRRVSEENLLQRQLCKLKCIQQEINQCLNADPLLVAPGHRKLTNNDIAEKAEQEGNIAYFKEKESKLENDMGLSLVLQEIKDHNEKLSELAISMKKERRGLLKNFPSCVQWLFVNDNV